MNKGYNKYLMERLLSEEVFQGDEENEFTGGNIVVGGLKSIKIGDQIWTTENYNGIDVPVIEDADDWNELNDEDDDNVVRLTTPAMCYYNNDKSKGALYNFYAIEQLKVPNGWRVPTDNDWTKLTDYLKENDIKIKESGLNLTYDGYRFTNGNFKFIGEYGYWWSATTHGDFAADIRNLWLPDSDYLYGGYRAKSNGLSVRLVRNL